VSTPPGPPEERSPWQRPAAGSAPAGPPGLGGGQPPPPYQPPDYRPGYAPARSGRRTLALVAAVAALAVVLVGVLVLVVFRGNPRDTADAFMAALQAKDVDKAHSLLCRDGQQKESTEELRRSFDLDSRTITGYRLGTERERQREGKDETLVPVTITYDRGAEVEIDLGVWDEGGQKVCSLNPPGG
jgi:hypothetical protein